MPVIDRDSTAFYLHTRYHDDGTLRGWCPLCQTSEIVTISVSPFREPYPRHCDPSSRVADIIINGTVSAEWSLSTLGMYWHVIRNGMHVAMTEIGNLYGVQTIIERETSK